MMSDEYPVAITEEVMTDEYVTADMVQEGRSASYGAGGGPLRERTKAFALACIHLYTRLPKTTEAQLIGKQMIRSGTSVGAHYREAIRARSPAEFISKVEGGLQELEETGYWLELLQDAQIVSPGNCFHFTRRPTS